MIGSAADSTCKPIARPTLKDVAREAGVHFSTVSLVLAGSPRISPNTVRRVRDAAERLHYAPNRSAQALRRSRTVTLAFVFWGNSIQSLPVHFHEYTLAAAQAALEADYHLLLVCVSEEQLREKPIDERLRSMGVDGALFVGDPSDRPGLARLVRNSFPIVHLGQRDLDGVILPYVSADYRQGGRLATEHLIKLGHRQIAAIHVSQPNAPEIARERVGGYLDALKKARLRDRVRCSDWRRPGDAAGNLAWLRSEGVTGVFCAEHRLAHALVVECRAVGVQVPEDLSVVAFDDIPDRPGLPPALTAIRQPRDVAGRRAVQLTLDILGGQLPNTPSARQIFLPTELIIRASTAPPPPTVKGAFL